MTTYEYWFDQELQGASRCTSRRAAEPRFQGPQSSPTRGHHCAIARDLINIVVALQKHEARGLKGKYDDKTVREGDCGAGTETLDEGLQVFFFFFFLLNLYEYSSVTIQPDRYFK